MAAAKKKTPTLSARSPLPAAALAAVLESPGHGYEIASRLRWHLGPSWHIYAKHLYRVLGSLERKGLVWSEEVPAKGGRNAKRSSERDTRVYYPTPAAIEAWERWNQVPARLSLVRADVHVRLVFSKPEEAPQLLEMLEQYEQDLLEALEANDTYDVSPVTWQGRMIGNARTSVENRLNGEIASIRAARRDIEEYLAEGR
jgi:DNA-binding PadR family transcriptional regulator